MREKPDVSDPSPGCRVSLIEPGPVPAGNVGALANVSAGPILDKNGAVSLSTSRGLGI